MASASGKLHAIAGSTLRSAVMKVEGVTVMSMSPALE